MRWYYQWSVDGPVQELPYLPDSEEAAILRIAIKAFVEYWEVACIFGIQHENADIGV